MAMAVRGRAGKASGLGEMADQEPFSPAVQLGGAGVPAFSDDYRTFMPPFGGHHRPLVGICWITSA